MVLSAKKASDAAKKPASSPHGSGKKPSEHFVTLENADIKMASFIKYYKGIELVAEEEWDDFMKALLTKFPITFRISKSHRVSNNSLEGRKGMLTQPELLRDLFKTTLLPSIQEQIINETPADVQPVTWYPNKMVWQGNFTNDDVRKYEGLVELGDFFADEVTGPNLWKTEPSMIVPPLLLTVQPHHKILDMCASQGVLSVHLLELLYSNPRKLPDGFLISNDTSKARRINRWWSATNTLGTCHDAKEMPDYYLADGKKIIYDRILLDPPCTNDGSFGKNVVARSDWKVNKCMEYHKDQLAMLQRAVELLATGGELLYTTTSMHPVENEAVVAAILRKAQGTVELVDVRSRVPGFKSRPGMSKWKVMFSGLSFFETLESVPETIKADIGQIEESVFQPKDEEITKFHLDRCLRVVPHDNKSGAFFCAVLKKKTAIPWVPETIEVKPEPEEAEPKKSREELLKSLYTQPLKLMFDVSVCEMEWTTDVTDHNLDTKTSVAVESFPDHELQVSDKSINKTVRKELENQIAFLTSADDDWKFIKKFYKLSDLFLPSWLMKRSGGKDDKTIYYYLVHPVIRRILEANPKLVNEWTTRSSGLKVFKTFKHELTPDNNIIMCDVGLMALMQYTFARIVLCTRDDIVNLLSTKSLTFDKFSPRAKKGLETMEPGCLIFYYKAEGRAANPNCDITFVGWRNKTFVKDHIDPKTDDNINRNHYLRLCGVAHLIPKRPVSKLGLLPEKKVSDMETDETPAVKIEAAE